MPFYFIFQTLFVLAFICVPIIIISIKENNYLKAVNQLIEDGYLPNGVENVNSENNTNIKIDYNYSIKRPLFCIISYFVIFFVFSEVLALVFQILYLGFNEIPYEMIDQTSEMFNSNVYNEMVSDLNILLQAVIYGLAATVTLIFGLRWIIKDLKSFKGKYIGYAFMGFGLVYAGSMAGSMILSIIGINGEASNQEAIESMMSGVPNLLIMGIITIVLAPIVEELVFRKSIFKLFKRRKYLALVVSSLAFGALHVISSALVVLLLMLTKEATYADFINEIAFIIPYSLMGVGIGYAYIKSNQNIITAIIAHALNNALSFVLMLLLPLLEQFLQ